MVKNLPDSAADMGSVLGLGRRKWQPIPVFLPEKCHGQRSPKCCKELTQMSTAQRVRDDLVTKATVILVFSVTYV